MLGFHPLTLVENLKKHLHENAKVTWVAPYSYNDLLVVDDEKPDLDIVNAVIEESKKQLVSDYLRNKRNSLIASTDWWVLPDRTPTQAQLDFRQALRDLPSNSPNAALDEQGNLINVEWPKAP